MWMWYCRCDGFKTGLSVLFSFCCFAVSWWPIQWACGLSGKLSLSLYLSFSLRFNGHFPGELGLAGVYWSKGWWKSWRQLDYWRYKSCKAQVKSSPWNKYNDDDDDVECDSGWFTYWQRDQVSLSPSTSTSCPTVVVTEVGLVTWRRWTAGSVWYLTDWSSVKNAPTVPCDLAREDNKRDRLGNSVRDEM